MIKKFLSSMLAACIVCTSLSAVVMAAESSFSDVTSAEYGWVIDDIESMTRLGIIKGYTDGTFRPSVAIKKIEMLLLMARVAGYTDANYAPYAEYATALYAPVLSGYDLGDTYNRYKSEVSFLLYKGIIGLDDLGSLLGQAGTALKRYEAAVLLTKLMNAESQVNNTAVVLEYIDYTSIPAAARGYVEYVTNQGIMRGVGDNSFAPQSDVTRAQMAALLRRVINELNYSTLTGTVSRVRSSSITLDSKSAGSDLTVSVDSDTVITINGMPASISEIDVDSRVLVLYSGTKAVSVEVLTGSEQGSTISGTMVNAIFDDDIIYLYVEDNNGKELELTLDLETDPRITLDGSLCDFNDLRPGLYAVINAVDNDITSIAALSSTPSTGRGVSGTIVDISLSSEYILSVLVKRDNEIYDYSVASNVSVIRNGSSARLRDLLVGDDVVITESGGVISEIVATSSSSSASGVITSIYIGTEPRITIRSDGDEDVYSVASAVQVTIDGAEASLYDLRLGSYVELELESDSVIYINSVTTSSTFRMSGTISDVNVSYGYVNIETDDGYEQIFLNVDGSYISTVIVDGATGDTVDPSELESGQYVTVVGSYTGGIMTAKTILIIPE